MLDFLCIGAQKSGTTWLHAQLERHPQVAFPGGKEVHYWNAVQEGRRPADLNWYCQLFADRPGRRLGDMTPAYATLQPEAIGHIREQFPDVRILYILRNPIERAWSAARMFMDWCQLEPDEADEAWFSTLFHSRASRGRGDYETTLRRWYDAFGQGAVRVLFYEDLVSNPRDFLKSVAEHLEIDAQPLTGQGDEFINSRVRMGPEVPLPPALRKELLSLYESRVRSLSSYLGIDLSHWLD